LFVVVLGAAPSIANGVIGGIDQIPPLTLRAGRALGARGVRYYTRIVLPAAISGFTAGLKQGWAFAWRSLMAGELLVTLPGIGSVIEYGRSNFDLPLVYASMVVILVIGLVADSLVFGRLERAVNRRWGLAT
jgi:NitT/TauT family transport system permease protein